MKTTIASIVCLLWLALGIASAQTTSSTTAVVAGQVMDSSGNPVPSARIELENLGTGQRMTVTADSHGRYRFDQVPVGRYRVYTTLGHAVSAPTREVEVTQIGLTAFDLTVPSATALTDSILTAQTVSISEKTAQIATDFNSTYVQQLAQPNLVSPNGSAYGAYNLSLLSSAVTQPVIGQDGRGPAIAGQRPISNNFHVDGTDNNNRVMPGPLVYMSNEATNDSALFRGQFSPEFGHSAGGMFNSIVRSGTNEVHGSIYDYLQNRNLNAVDQSFARMGVRDNPRYDQNRLGASLGLPILPSKLFFFGNFEYIPLGYDRPFGGQFYAPTQAGFNALAGMPGISATNLGILQSSLGANVPATATTTMNINGSAVPMGIVPAMIHGFQNQYVGSGAIDANIRNVDQLRLRYVHNDMRSSNAGAMLPSFVTPTNSTAMLASAGWYHTFRSTVTNELRFGFNRFDQNYPSGNFSYPGLAAFPNIQIGNLAFGPQYGAAQSSIINTYQLSESLAVDVGRHNIRFGFDGRRSIGSLGNLAAARGMYSYSGLDRFLLDLTPDVMAVQSFGNSYYSGNQFLLFPWIQDAWRIHPNFLLNLGLRYEYATIPTSIARQGLNAAASVPGVLEFGEPRSQTRNFAPNVGFAWTPSFAKTAVIRAGFGMNYDALYTNTMFMPFAPQFGTTLWGMPGSQAGFLANGGLQNPAMGFSGNMSPAQARALTSTWFPNQELPYSMEWNVAVQREIWRKFTGEIKYLGSRGVHLPVWQMLNNASPVTAQNSLPVYFQQPSQAALNALPVTLASLQASAANRPLAQYGFTNPIFTVAPDGNSIYHGLAITLDHRFTGGFQMLGSYTWSHLIDDATGGPLDLAYGRQRANSIFDRRHRVVVTGLWDVAPLFRNTYSVVRNVLANVAISGTYTYESPAYVTAMSGTDAFLNGAGFGAGAIFNPNGLSRVGSDVTPLMNSFGQTVAYLANNPNAQWIRAGAGTFPNARRNSFPLDPTNNFDVALTKRFSYHDRWAFEVRGDAYNIFNHPQFTGTGINTIDFRSMFATPGFLMPGSTDFGNLGSALSSHARLLQVALRVNF